MLAQISAAAQQTCLRARRIFCRRASCKGALATALVGTALLVAACGTDGGTQLTGRGMACVDDSQTCITERSAALNHLMSDKQRAWVQQPATPEAYASGVRLFAFKQKKKEMTCDELAIGRREAEAGPATLRGPQGKGLSPAQISRGVMLATEVARELDGEAKRRCRA